MDNELFITESQRNKLLSAYKIIEKLQNEISLEYEEYSAIDTTLYYLNNAIRYKEKFY